MPETGMASVVTVYGDCVEGVITYLQSVSIELMGMSAHKLHSKKKRTICLFCH